MTTENNYMETDLGNVSPNPRGDYDVSASYEYLDLVNLEGGSYLCLAEGTITGIPPVPGKTTENWQCLVLPGDLTPEYIAMHDRVANLAEQAAEDARLAQESEENVASMEENVRLLQAQTAEAAEAAEKSKDQAAGYASAADMSRLAAEAAEVNVDARVTGFDAHVAEKTADAEAEITGARQVAVNTVVAQQDASVQAVKDQTAEYTAQKQEEAESAIQTIVDGLNLDVESMKQEVSAEGAKQIGVIENAGDVQKTAVNNAGAARVQEVNSAGIAQTQAVNSAGSTQVQAVTAEGTAQVQNVREAAAEITGDREQIHQNKDDIAVLKVQKADLTEVDGIVLWKETEAAENHVLTDSADFPFLGMELYGRSEQRRTTGAQLLELVEPTTISKSGITVAVDSDGIITVDGTREEGATNITFPIFKKVISDATIYTVSFVRISGNVITAGGYFQIQPNLIYTRITDSERTFNAPDGINNAPNIRFDAGQGFENFKIKIMLNAGSSALPWEPYTGGKSSPNPEYPQRIVSAGDTGEITIRACGKNLLKNTAKSATVNGITFTVNEDGSVMVNGTATADSGFSINTFEFPNRAKDYILSGTPENGSSATYSMYIQNSDWTGSAKSDIGSGARISAEDFKETVIARIWIKKGVKANNLVFCPMIRFADIGDAAFEPYGQQPVALSAPNGLPGLPVSSGGNYTDETGQQWVCDEIDLVRGKYVQRVLAEMPKTTFIIQETSDYPGRYFCQGAFKNIYKNGSSECLVTHGNWGSWGLEKRSWAVSATALYYSPEETTTAEELRETIIAMINSDTPLTFLAQLATPIESDLTAEEIAAYRALHTNTPTTIIQSDVPVKVRYALDTERYITENYVSKDSLAEQMSAKANAEDTMSWSKWFDVHRTGWHGGVTFPRFEKSPSVLGTKTGDNADIVIETSTAAAKGRNDFANSPVTDLMFNGIEVNGYIDEDGDPHITAVKGSPEFSRDGSNGDVYMAFLTPFYKRVYNDEVDGWDFADHPVDGMKPWDGAVRPDGTYRSFYFVAKYPGVKDDDGIVASISGRAPIRSVSHNNQINTFKAKGTQYCGFTSTDMAWAQWMFDMKFATRNSQSKLAGTTSYNYTYPATVVEEDVKRIIIAKSQAANLLVGSCVSIGYGTVYNGTVDLDRGRSTNPHKYADDVKILKIEDYDDSNSAVYVDAPAPFSTASVALNDTLTSPVYLFTMHWHSGACDEVQGPDGSPTNCTSGKEPFVLSGVELGHGGYMVISDIILNGVYDADTDTYSQTPYIVDDNRKIATSITDDYVELCFSMPDTANAWKYISEQGYDARYQWLALPTETAASSSTGYCDGLHTGERKNGLREVLWSGVLLGWSVPGLRCVLANLGVSWAWWGCLLRLSSLRRGKAA